MMHVRDYKASDILDIQNSIIEPFEEGFDLAGWAHANEETGPGFTFVTEDGIVSVAGVRLSRHRVGYAWAALTPCFIKEIRLCLILLRGILQIVAEQNCLKAIRATVGKDFTKGQTLLKHLGFKKRRELPKLDSFLYERKIWDSEQH
jgi:hypothetical protein